MATPMEKLRRLLDLEGEGQPTAASRTVDFSGMPSRGPMAEMARRAERKKRGESRMGSDKNVSAGTGRGTTAFTPDRKASAKPQMRPSTVKDSMDIPVSPVVETAGIAGLPGSPSGVSAEREAARGSTTFFGPTPEDAAAMAEQAPRMRKGLFGEEIPEDMYQEMERKNKEAGFYGRFKKGGSVKKKATKKYASGGSVSSASKRGDGCAQRGKTRGRLV